MKEKEKRKRKREREKKRECEPILSISLFLQPEGEGKRELMHSATAGERGEPVEVTRRRDLRSSPDTHLLP